MSLKEQFEIAQSQQAAAAKTDDYCQRMFEELGLQSKTIRSCGGGAKLYKNTLPIELRPEYQALIDEFIEICPFEAWKKSPDKVDRAAASCRWKGSDHLGAPQYLWAFYHGCYTSQIKLSDGSIHLYNFDILSPGLNLGSECDLVKPSLFFYEREKEKMRLSGIEKVLQEAQAKLDHLRQYKYGTGEFVHLKYRHRYSDRSDYDTHIYLFREKSLYALGNLYYAPYKEDRNEFERWLLAELNRLNKDIAAKCT